MSSYFVICKSFAPKSRETAFKVQISLDRYESCFIKFSLALLLRRRFALPVLRIMKLQFMGGKWYDIAKAVFDALGAKTFVINAEPNGTNINLNAGSTHIEGLRDFVIRNSLDAGFAYDVS